MTIPATCLTCDLQAISERRSALRTRGIRGYLLAFFNNNTATSGKGGRVIDEKPLSEKINEYDGGEYWVTAAIWRTRIGHNLYDTFEIGIRHKKSGNFKLLQSDFNHQTVQEVANAIAHLLSIPGECYQPEWCMEHFK